MNEILLLEGPDGCRYKATKIYDTIWWNVTSFANLIESDWWKSQRKYPTWKYSIDYTTEELENTFTILAKTEQKYEPNGEIIFHYD